jgi:hypothetical protein
VLSRLTYNCKWNITKRINIFYYKNVKSPNLDLKQGIYYLERERREGGKESD